MDPEHFGHCLETSFELTSQTRQEISGPSELV